MDFDSTSDFSLDLDFPEFNPLADLESDDEFGEDTQSFLETASAGEMLSRPKEIVAKPDTRTPKERTDDLLAAMATRRSVLLGIMKYCLEPMPVDVVNAHVDKLQENNHSIYSAANLCSLLEKAGALERVDANGEHFTEGEVKPKTVVIDGVEFLEPGEEVEVFWLTTDAGRATLAEDRPLERLRELFAEEEQYLTIYQRILELCNTETGALTPALADAVDNDPLVQKPRYYATRFVDRLEKCDALLWQKAWVVTEVGEAGLALLAELLGKKVED